MHLITLRALRRLISGVDIAPGMIRQEYFFHFITSLAIYVHLITISHLRQFPPVADMSLYLFISDFFHLITPKHSSENSLQVSVAHVHLLFCGFEGGRSPILRQKCYYTQLIEGPLRPTTASQAPLKEKEERGPLDLAKVLPVTLADTRGIYISCLTCTWRGQQTWPLNTPSLEML